MNEQQLAWAGFIIGAVGLLPAVVGIAVSIVQTGRIRRLSDRRQATMRHVIERANTAKLESEIIQDLVNQHPEDELLSRYLWTTHQACVDLYLQAVDEYLFHENKFSYSDLQSIADTPLVGGSWQLRAWVGKIANRKENQGESAPSYTTTFNNTRVERHRQLRRSLEAPGVTGSGHSTSSGGV